MTKALHVTGIGHALVDIIAHCDDALLDEFGLVKGIMRLTTATEAEAIYARMVSPVESSGGSAANTCAGLASFGARVGFMGQVGKDQFADVFTHDMRTIGVTFTPAHGDTDEPTGRCLILVSPGGERTMNTNLGAAAQFSDASVDADLIKTSQILYLEGYLFDPLAARAAFHTASDIAHNHECDVAFTLSDPFCVDRHRAAFRDFIRERVDILFANEKELMSLYLGASFDEACAALRSECSFAVITRSEKGSIIFAGREEVRVQAEPVEHMVDATGAGDLYAAGFLFGLTAGRDLLTCGRLGGLAAAEVISHIGPRPLISLKELAKSRGLI